MAITALRMREFYEFSFTAKRQKGVKREEFFSQEAMEEKRMSDV
jgi:hypothetical protein